MRLASIPAGVPFLDTLARRWLEAHGADALARGLVLLPTRRAARSLAEAFLRQGGGRPMLLPRIAALGAPDEAPLALAGALELPPAIEAQERLGALAALVLKLPAGLGGAGRADRALLLAGELAALMDEAERAGIEDLPGALAGLADGSLAEHWQATLRFLDIVTRAWPDFLAAGGLMNPAARQVALLRAQARAWREQPPGEPVWVAGTTAGIPAVAELLGVVARLPQGCVVLPGLDCALPESAWEAIEDSHPQAGMKHLLARLGAVRDDVACWDGPASAPAGRAAMLAQALLPASAVGAWRAPGPAETAGLYRLEAADEQEEAAAIALILREALEQPGRRAALVTPDRALAGRVAAELLRWGVVADDSAGEKLADSPPAVFLRLLAEAVAARLAPVPLLALLKHPLAAAGRSPAACREAARGLERAALRGPKPPPGLAGLRARAAAVAGDLLPALEACLEPLLRLDTAVGASVAPDLLLAALVEAAEALAATDTEPGPARLWAQEEGEALAVLLAGARPALLHLPDQPPSVLPGLLDALLEGAVVRSRRALRGRDGGEHPRVFIWGLLEARLQATELIVLGGLVEGVWPPATDPGPWMSRPMRARAGLPGTEEVVGQSAHDFFLSACAAPQVVLSCPRRRDGAPAVPARWLTRLEAYLRGRDLALPRHPAAAWAGQLDQPEGPPVPVPPPAPRPPVGRRPRRLSVTAIETWLADPYAIHARYILRLEALKPLEEATDAADYGALVHRGMQLFVAEVGAGWPADGPELLGRAMQRALAEAGLRQALQEWWRPRLLRIAAWVAVRERARRAALPALIRGEVRGEWRLAVPGGFMLTGRADRIERRADGRLAILDYKTGLPPTDKEVEAGFRPQLPLEAAMAEAGAFGPELAGETAELVYWHLTGGFVPAEERVILRADATRLAAAVATARDRLAALVMAFDDAGRAYLSQPHPGQVLRFSDYAQLARVAEWDLSGDEA